MARKKYLDNDENDGKVQQQQHLKGGQVGVPFHQQSHTHHQFGVGHGHFLGGGTKNHSTSPDYHHPNAKNADESYGAVGKQLSTLGLSIREMPGDGNCLFRALSDQVTGTSRNHMEYRRSVVQYMKDYRPDFEPFVEDDVPFDKYVHRLLQPGTFAGNDAIVAFARCQNVSVVIHQLNLPAWVIHPSKDSHNHLGGREVHIFYHNGDHYNSVRRIGDDSESPANIKLHSTSSSKPSFNKPNNNGKKSPPHSASSNSSATMHYSDHYDPYEGKRDEDNWVKDSSDIDRLVEEIMVQTNYPDEKLVRETLMEYHFDMVATIDFIISISVVMNQQQECEKFNPPPSALSKTEMDATGQLIPQELHKPADETPQTEDLKIVVDSSNSAMDEPSLSITADEDDVTKNSPAANASAIIVATTAESSVADETDGSISPTTDSISSQEKSEEKLPTRKNAKVLSSRQKKEQKKRERKREADLRRKVPANSIPVDKENTVVKPTLGSLDI